MDAEVQVFEYGMARCTVLIKDGKGFVSHLYSRLRGQGHATGVLTAVCEFADKNGLELYLFARGYGGPVQTMLNSEQLVAFYEKFGFVNESGGRLVNAKMVRPRTKNTPYNEREDFS